MSRTDDMGRLRQEIQAGHRGRIDFFIKLRRAVADLRKGLMDENRAAHAAWFGPTRAEVAKAARIKEEAAAARAKEVAKAARVREAAEDALKKAPAKTAPVKATKKVRGR